MRQRRVDLLHDVGDSLNETIDRGQIEGGFVQGMGWLTTEELVFDGQGRLLIRYSGTEPLLRIMIEGRRQDEIRAWAEEIAAAVRAHLA